MRERESGDISSHLKGNFRFHWSVLAIIRCSVVVIVAVVIGYCYGCCAGCNG